jgi:hypothetical protein
MIPMNDKTIETIMRLRERAKEFHGIEPQHYVFPACEHGHVDHARVQTSLRTDGGGLQKLLGLPDCASTTFAYAITELAESQVSGQTIMAIAGHVSQKILARYSHVRSEARRQAVTALSAKPKGSSVQRGRSEGYDTNHGTTKGATDMPAPKVIEEMVGTRRLELLTSTVSILR